MDNYRRELLLGLMAMGLTTTHATAQTQDELENALKAAIGKTSKKTSSTGLPVGVTKTTADKGIREALSLGAVAAVTRVGRDDGYWGDDLVRIPLPKTIAKVQKTLKPLGMSGALDEVHEKVNHAAEVAAPVAKDLFLDAIKSITLTDVVSIVRGGPTSGTQYLQKSTTPRLITLFTPPMGEALQSTGAVQSLDQAIERNGLGAYIKKDPKTYLSEYAVGKALDGLFYYVGNEERAIRTNPASRTTDLLKAVFG
ncbi:DUF4197 domain-containing protein [Asticcacaulis endophyticus]|uniref:DUF4197 domain-containing protein n=1 Tax=Asticcacaulis endophyticus TaxID=1395890 RepID=A0A918PUW7_9CAUL|nr:DUF4197 domain-containing protein [Asticcacaulis endophyticus]GGZ21427.1 hypothetical protein GCM10011273_02640 [Asticcacaulis endophyticus]